LSRFFIRTGTRFHRDFTEDPNRFPEIKGVRYDDQLAAVEHDFHHPDPGYAKAIDRVLVATHAINRRPIRDTAREFDGVM